MGRKKISHTGLHATLMVSSYLLFYIILSSVCWCFNSLHVRNLCLFFLALILTFHLPCKTVLGFEFSGFFSNLNKDLGIFSTLVMSNSAWFYNFLQEILTSLVVNRHWESEETQIYLELLLAKWMLGKDGMMGT